jgi:hypothetical protein
LIGIELYHIDLNRFGIPPYALKSTSTLSLSSFL